MGPKVENGERRASWGFFHSLPLQLCADESSVSFPGSGPKKMVLIFAPVTVGTGLWLKDIKLLLVNSCWTPGHKSLSSSLWENFALGAVHCIHRFLHHPGLFFFFSVSVRFGSSFV